MDYTSTLETLEIFWMALSICSAHRVGALVILYPLVKVSITGNCSWESIMNILHSQSIIKSAM